ncbi:MAG: TIGR03808 family TAT-translocated repetitive protein, partial [Xanthobacteraceae bacterium]
MGISRRDAIGAAATALLAGATPAWAQRAPKAAPLASTFGLDATHYGVRPGSPDDQTRLLQRALDEA